MVTKKYHVVTPLDRFLQWTFIQVYSSIALLQFYVAIPHVWMKNLLQI